MKMGKAAAMTEPPPPWGASYIMSHCSAPQTLRKRESPGGVGVGLVKMQILIW